MDTKTLSDFIAWSKTTDLQEIIYKKDGVNVEIKKADAAPCAADFSAALVPVKATAVGIYHAGAKGKALALKENTEVKEGAYLGSIEMNKTSKEVISPAPGVLKIIAITDGSPVEYGQPIFFIEPK